MAESSLKRKTQSAKRESKSLPKAKKTAKTGKLTVEVYSATGRKAGTVELPREIFGSEINKALMAQAVRIYLANQRIGTASTKTRGEVKGSSRKIYRQKGTGRARHGSIRAPIFVGGGIVFGPKRRDFGLKFPKKMGKAALVSALSSKFKDGEIKVYSGLDKIDPKTKIMASLLKTSGVMSGKNLLIVSSSQKELESLYRSARNIKDLRILPVNLINCYEVLNNKQILLMKEAINSIS